MGKNQQYIAIGDIHGCKRTLVSLLEKIAKFNNHIFVFIGDYIDRGPDSKGVVEEILSFSRTHECVFLRGNHEQMLLDAQKNGNFEHWIANGGDDTLYSYRVPSGETVIPDEHQLFFENTRLHFDTKLYFFVHAGVPPDRTIKESLQTVGSDEYFLWGRAHLNVISNVWEKKVVFGHTPNPEPIYRSNMIGIDTGCVYSGRHEFTKLTAVKLPEEEFIFQKNIETQIH